MEEEKRRQLEEKRRTLTALRLEKQRRDEIRNNIDPGADPRVIVAVDGPNQRQNGELVRIKI
jgi:hypothetical protein